MPRGCKARTMQSHVTFRRVVAPWCRHDAKYSGDAREAFGRRCVTFWNISPIAVRDGRIRSDTGLDTAYSTGRGSRGMGSSDRPATVWCRPERRHGAHLITTQHSIHGARCSHRSIRLFHRQPWANPGSAWPQRTMAGPTTRRPLNRAADVHARSPVSGSSSIVVPGDGVELSCS